MHKPEMAGGSFASEIACAIMHMQAELWASIGSAVCVQAAQLWVLKGSNEWQRIKNETHGLIN